MTAEQTGVASRAPGTRTATACGLGLGLDIGGTGTRWALQAPGGALIAEGSAEGWSALRLSDPNGRAVLAAVLQPALRARTAAGHAIAVVVAGVTGFDGGAQRATLASLIGQACAPDNPRVHPMNDIELACRAAFPPGGGIVVSAGTGSVAAFLDTAGELHRAGGRGGSIDDGGSGHWIACRALRQVWRAEDEAPGSGVGTPLGRHLLAHMDVDADVADAWAGTRSWVYGADRGRLGTLARAVAAAAHSGDAVAADLLREAGVELARLVAALQRRHGTLPVLCAGRVFELAPSIEAALRAGLPAGQRIERGARPAHRAAAELAMPGAAALS